MSRWGVVALLAACTGGASPTKTPTTTTGSGSGSDVSQIKKPGMPKPTVNWVKGPALTASAAELVAWFDAQMRNGKPRMTRVPIVMKREKFGNTIGGFTNQGVKIGPIEASVTDGALGISLKMRSHSFTGETCPFIVEGFWRGKDDRGYLFEIRDASRHPITPEELAAFTHAEVEGESGN